jgi:hypothetical protein
MNLLRKTGLLLAVVIGLVTGCGGGGSGTGNAAAPTATVAGTAATGAAIAAGAVSLKCVSGTATVSTTGTDGSFSIDVSGVGFPCVGRVDYKDASGAAQKLHTLVSSAGVANITPITELLLASLTGAPAADAFDKFDPVKTKAFTTAQIKLAVAAVKTYLKTTLGVDTTNLPDDPVGTKFIPKWGSTPGDTLDKVLDDLKAKLAALGKTLAGASGDLGAPGGTGGSGVTPGVGTLTVSAASNPARNGSYNPAGARFAVTGSTDFGFNGQTADGKFEVEVVVTAGGTIKRAHIWFFDSGTPKFFGCDGGKAIACTGIGWEPLLKQVLFNSTVQLAEVTPDLTGVQADVLVGGGETMKVLGSLEVK